MVVGEPATHLWSGGTPHCLEIHLVGHCDASSADTALRTLSARFDRFVQNGARIDLSLAPPRCGMIQVDCRLWPDIRTLLSHLSSAIVAWDGESAWGMPYQAAALQCGVVIGTDSSCYGYTAVWPQMCDNFQRSRNGALTAR